MSLVRRLCLLVPTLALVAVGLAVPAEAGPGTVLCTGFTDCGAKKYSSQGWYKAYTNSYWGQGKGHNCTNYVAYRLTHTGRVTAKVPDLGTASGWDNKVTYWTTWGATKVVGEPRPGDVAYWEAGVNGAGSTGHVAYVESVDPEHVVVSEDNAGGTYRWVQLAASSRPSGYLRFAQASGTPLGQVTSLTSPATNRVVVKGFATDPDTFATGVKLQVRVHDAKGVARNFSTSTPVQHKFSVSFTSSSMPSGTLTVETRAFNAPGTAGNSWALVDTRTVRVR